MSSECVDFEYEVYPRFEDTDAYGIMHHSRYLVFVEEAKLAFMKDPNFFGIELMGEDEKYLVTELNVKYIHAVKYSAKKPLNVKLKFTIQDDVRFRFDFTIFNDNKVACKGHTIHVMTDKNGNIKFTLPQHLLDRYSNIKKGE